MRRQYRGRTDAMVKSQEGEQGFWPSYADMMSAVALILFFLMLLSYISNMITGNNLKNTESQLEDTRIQLVAREKELNELESTLAVTKQQVEDAASELQKVSEDLDEVKVTLAAKEEDLAGQPEDPAGRPEVSAGEPAERPVGPGEEARRTAGADRGAGGIPVGGDRGDPGAARTDGNDRGRAQVGSGADPRQRGIGHGRFLQGEDRQRKHRVQRGRLL